MQDAQEDLAWSLYWAEDRLQSCVASGADEDQKRLDSLWRDFAGGLQPDDRVLDLATGNGAVPAALLAVRADLTIEAVDRARVDPLKYLSQSHSLEAVKFHPETDILKLPFGSASFDAVTSQFGIEYAGLSQATAAVMPCLRPGGRFQFIIHHADSDIIQSSHLKIIEIEQLINPGGLLETLISMLRGETDFSALEALGKDYMEQDIVRTTQISGQVFAGIEQLSESLVSDPKRAIELGAALNLRLRSEYHRLCQMKNAAQSKHDMDLLVADLTSLSTEVSDLRPIYIDAAEQDYLLAWLVSGLHV